PAMAAHIVFQQRERASETGELHQGAVYRRRDVRPDDSGPSPGEEDTAHHEADEQQVDDHHEVSASPVPHLVTCHTTYPARACAGRRDRLDLCDACDCRSVPCIRVTAETLRLVFDAEYKAADPRARAPTPTIARCSPTAQSSP